MPIDNKESEIVTLGREWARQLRACQYAGEIIVSEKELPRLARMVRRDLSSPHPSKHTKTCLFVLAVNCMYYNHDEKGFWAHFCPLIGIYDQAWLGDIIESKLLEFLFHHHPGYGPYKNVTPLRDQCGITRSEIPRFAELMRWMSEQYGWDGIRILEHERLSGIVTSRHLSRHLTSFLKANQGQSFIRDVARNISQFQRHIILNKEELATLKGYRPGFIAELIDAMGTLPEPASPVTRPPVPRLLFLPEYRQVGLCFDSRASMRGDYRIYGDVLRQTPYLWQSPDDYSTSITGTRRDSNGKWSHWSIVGWDPTKYPVALFHVNRGYVDHRTSKPPPGEYYMLGPYTSPPPQEVCASEGGMVDLPFPEIELDAWRIIITTSTDLAFLGINSSSDIAAIDLISWSETRSRIPGTFESTMAFTSSLPLLTLHRADLFTANAVALFIDDGVESRRVPIESRASSVRLDVRAPSQGRVWVEPISRLREFAGIDTLSELQYYLLPECDIQWPRSLYSLDEQPEISLSTRAADLSLELDNATPVNADKRLWRAHSGITVLQGRLRTLRFDVPVAHRLHRATLREQQKQIAAYMLPEHLQNPSVWILAGLPLEGADIVITDGTQILPLSKLGTFNHAGEFRFPGAAIRYALSRWKVPVGCLAVSHADRAVLTSTLYVDCSALTEWVWNAVKPNNSAWITILTPPLRSFVGAALNIREAPQSTVPLPDDIELIPSPLQSFFATLRACSAIFDNALLPELPEMLRKKEIAEIYAKASKQKASLLLWYLKALAFIQKPKLAQDLSSGALLKEYASVHWTLPFPRWQTCVDELVADLKSDVDPIDMLQEWKQDVEAGFRSSYASRIAKQDINKTLTVAWIQYSHHGNFQVAINSVSHLLPQEGSSVAALAAILLVLCYMRMGLFASQPPIELVNTNRILSAAFGELTGLALIGGITKFDARPALLIFSRLLPSLPLRNEDLVMIKTVRGDSDTNSSDRDWLTCYLLCRLHEAGVHRQEPKVARLTLEDVPASSPERQRIIETLERYVHD